MKYYFGVGLGMLVGVAIGAVAVSGLHAQGKAQVYLITEIDVKDPDNQAKNRRVEVKVYAAEKPS